MTTRPSLMTAATLLLGLLAAGASCRAEGRPPVPLSATDAAASDAPSVAALLRHQAAELAGALRDYRASLERLLAIQERALATAVERQRPRRGLYESGILSRREFEEGELAVAAAQRNVDDTRRAIDAADHATVEATTLEALAALPPLAMGEDQRTAAVYRYQGPAAWSLQEDAAKLRKLFMTRFGRALPVSAFGQTPMHDRMGFDHRNALDVAVHPDSPEGKALVDYLRAEGIPFIAYRGAVPGSASGAHIHVGQPSPRISARR